VVAKDLVEVHIPLTDGRPGSYTAGQYIFLNVPSISALQWHPFSLTSTPREAAGKYLVFHVKALGGEGSWTSRLLADASGAKDGKLQVKIDGFYGHDVASKLATPRTAIMLVGGGVGVTPLLSILSDLSARPTTRVALLWCTRTREEFLTFAPRIAAAKARLGERLHARVAITRFIPSTTPGASIDEQVSTLADDARGTPPQRYGLPVHWLGNNPGTAPKECSAGQDPAGFTHIVTSPVWFAFLCLISIIVMTLVFDEVEYLEEQCA